MVVLLSCEQSSIVNEISVNTVVVNPLNSDILFMTIFIEHCDKIVLVRIGVHEIFIGVNKAMVKLKIVSGVICFESNQTVVFIRIAKTVFPNSHQRIAFGWIVVVIVRATGKTETQGHHQEKGREKILFHRIKILKS